jgi:Ca2+-binding RTX toxin-like protein
VRSARGEIPTNRHAPITTPSRLIGTPGDDEIVGSGSADTILGPGGEDIVCGEGGNDRLLGGPDADVLIDDQSFADDRRR